MRYWFEDSAGERYLIPENAEYPIQMGRVTGIDENRDDSVQIPQKEESMTVSRLHAKLWAATEEDTFMIADAGSSHGLFMGEEKLEPDVKSEIKPGDTVRLGLFELTLCSGDPDVYEDDDEEVTRVPGLDGTAVLDDFVPGQGVPDFNAEPTEEEKLYLDIAVGEEIKELPFPMKGNIKHWTIGRSPEKKAKGDAYSAHVRVPNRDETRTVSRMHAEIRRNGDSLTISSISAQGIHVSGRKVSGDDETVLENGDKIVMGQVVCIFRIGPKAVEYSLDDFSLESALGTAKSSGAPDEMPTRSIPRAIHAEQRMGDDEKPWGYLIENKLIDPRKYALTGRRIRIGSHPLNSDIKMEGAGITDNYAVFQWGGKGVRIASKSSSSPVRVDHAPYRKSPPLRDGNIITLGTQEYKLDIIGEPPVAASTIVQNRVRRTFLLFVIIMAGSLMAALYATVSETPEAKAVGTEPDYDSRELLHNVVDQYGLAGLALAKKTPVYNQTDEKTELIFKKLEQLAEAHELIHQTPAKFFDDDAPKIERLVFDGGQVFSIAGVGTPNSVEWFQDDILDVFEKRRESAYSGQWADFLKALENTNILNSRRQLAALKHFPKDKRDQATRVLDEWEALMDKMAKQDVAKIFRGFREATQRAEGYDFINQQYKIINSLTDDFKKLRQNPSPPAQAITKSRQWAQSLAKITELQASLQTLKYYQDGQTEDFEEAIKKVKDKTQETLLATMLSNLKSWEAWQKEFNASSDPLGNYTLLIKLQDIQTRFSSTLDPRSPLFKDINAQIDAFQADRSKYAIRLRTDAAGMENGFEKLYKLIEAYGYDPTKPALQELDTLAVRLVGDIYRDKTTAQYQTQLRKVLKMYEELIGKKVLEPSSMNSRRQIQKLLSTVQ